LHVPLRSLCLKARAQLPMFVQESNDNGRPLHDVRAIL